MPHSEKSLFSTYLPSDGTFLSPLGLDDEEGNPLVGLDDGKENPLTGLGARMRGEDDETSIGLEGIDGDCLGGEPSDGLPGLDVGDSNPLTGLEGGNLGEEGRAGGGRAKYVGE